MLAGGGMLLLPACMQDEGSASTLLKNISISDKNEELLADITETIIPQTTTKGAKALNLHQFVLKMFDDLYDKDQQDRLVAGLKQFDNYVNKSTNAYFASLQKVQKLDILQKISSEDSLEDELKFFLEETRKWTVKGFQTSQYVLTELLPYELIPGRFHGCVAVNSK